MKRLNSFARYAFYPALLLVALFMLAGCVSGGAAKTVLRAPAGPAMDFAHALYERGAALQTFAAHGGITYGKGDARRYFAFELAAQKPNKILFTALDPAGRPAFRLASDGVTLAGIMYGSQEYFSGPATFENFGRFLPLGLSPEQVLHLVSGGIAPPAAAGAGEFDGRATELLILPADVVGMADEEKNLGRLKIVGDLQQNPQMAVLESASYGPPRKPYLAIRYNQVKPVSREDLKGRPEEPFPHSIEAQWDEQSLRVRYDEIRLGLPVNEKWFTLEKPQNFEFIQLD